MTLRWSAVRVACSIVLALAGCNGLFEENPEFLETDSEAVADDSDTGSSGDAGIGGDTTTNGGTSDAGTSDGATDEDGTTTAGSCEPDEHEVNDNVGSATGLMGVVDSGPTMGPMVPAALEGTGAVDWYRFGVIDMSGGAAPKVTVTGTPDLRVCTYYKCGDTDQSAVVQCGDEEAVTSENDYDGCCELEQSQPGYQCGGTPGGDATVFVRVSDSMDREECLPYTLQYLIQ